jgi:hypothetical protein
MDANSRIRIGLQPATLPAIENRARIVRMSIHSGRGERCAYCASEIHTEAVEYQVDAYIGAKLRSLSFHRVCLHLWEELLQRDGAKPDPVASFRHCSR